jgi:hypothetical protein
LAEERALSGSMADHRDLPLQERDCLVIMFSKFRFAKHYKCNSTPQRTKHMLQRDRPSDFTKHGKRHVGRCESALEINPFRRPMMTPVLAQFVAWHQVLTGIWIGSAF